jgi:hypothetical protein
LFISSEHLNKKRLAPDAARKRWLEHEQTEVAGIGGVGGKLKRSPGQ